MIGLASLLVPPGSILGAAVGAKSLIICSFLVITGFQWISFGLSARIFGITHGLLPPDRALASLFDRITLETGCVIGVILLLIGLVLFLFSDSIVLGATRTMVEQHENSLLRVILPAATLVTLGAQVVLTSFFFSMLGLQYDRSPKI